MQIHLLIALVSGIVLHESTASSLNLHTTPRLLLDILHIAPASAHDLCAEVETRDGFEVDWNALFGPFATAE